MAKFFLEQIRINSFGAFANKDIGPLSPNLNVIYGKNEAGKTSVAKFVEGLLFGWGRASAQNNAYKPTNAHRSGTLFFSGRAQDTPGGCGVQTNKQQCEQATLSRNKNSEGLCGDTWLVDDIDHETYSTIFSLNSDELRSLNNTTQVSAKLLTAGSGTNASPAKALAEIDAEIKTFTSTAAGAKNSLVNIRRQQALLKEQIRAAEDDVQRCKREKKELAQLTPQRNELQQHLSRADSNIAQLQRAQTKISELEKAVFLHREKLNELSKNKEKLEREHEQFMSQFPDELQNVSAEKQCFISDKIESLSIQEAKKQHDIDNADYNLKESIAKFETAKQAKSATGDTQRAMRQRHFKTATSAVLPLAFIFAGVPLFMHGRDISSLSFTVLGLGLVSAAIVLAFAIVVLLLRPNKTLASVQDANIENAKLVMIKDENQLKVCKRSASEFANTVHIELDKMSLQAAQGSLRRAKELLNKMSDIRQHVDNFNQRKKAYELDLGELKEQIEKKQTEISNIYAGLNVTTHMLDEIDAQLEVAIKQRDGLQKALSSLDERFGTLKQKLETALLSHEFDDLKFQYQQLETRNIDSMRKLTVLLLAHRQLQAAIAAWESESQPEVYRLASTLMSQMTCGKWVKVKMTDQGTIEVESAQRICCTPLHLSLGTCQQLYLALRIALLLTAQNVGRNIPIITDDILVNFDAERRSGAAQALASLAKQRQVIVMTCHKEVVRAFRDADVGLNEISLG